MSIPSINALNKLRLPVLLAVAVLSGCAREPENAADSVYSGGDILTTAGEQPTYVEALAVKDGKISFVGTKAEADKLIGKATLQVDLAGATLIPAIVTGVQQDLTLQGVSNIPNCWQEPNFKTKEDLIAALKAATVERVASGSGLFCTGYDPAIVTLTEADLDMAFKETSVILVESSLQRVLASAVAKQSYSRDAYKTLKSGIQNPDNRPVGLQVGQSADFMVLDKNPLKVTAEPWSTIQINQAFVAGKSVPDAAKDLSMLVPLDLNAAAAQEKAALAKIEEQRATETATKAAAKKTDVVAKKANTVTTPKPAAASTAAKQEAKRSNEKKSVAPKPAVVETPAAEEAPKPKEVRFNMTQDGKKMTPEDFDAWMKAQGIRIVPAKPVEAPPADAKKDGG